MAETPCCDPNAKPLTREERLERTIEQMSAEAVERARAYDDNNAFHQRRTADLLARLATAEAERDRLLRFVTEGNAIVERYTETRATGWVDQYRMPWTHSWFDTPEAAVADWLGRAPSTGGTP